MESSRRAVIAIVAAMFVLFMSLGLATAQALPQRWQATTLPFQTHQTFAEGSNHVRSAESGNQSDSTNSLAPSPPSTTMSVMVWVGIAAFVLGVIGVVIAAYLLRRLND